VERPDGQYGQPSDDETLLERAVRRRTGDRMATAEHEVRRMIDVGLALMRDNSGGSPKIADIVREAGVSNDAFYRAFRGKEDLVAAIVDDGTRRVLAYVAHQRDKVADPAGQLRQCVRAVLRQAGDPAAAATARAVLANASRHAGERAVGLVPLADSLAEVLLPPLAGLGSSDPGRDARALAWTLAGAVEHFVLSEQIPSAEDVDHLGHWALRAVTRGTAVTPPKRARRGTP
jgi:AcrR family transcriptional regulator